jgi:hypothetical protein
VPAISECCIAAKAALMQINPSWDFDQDQRKEQRFAGRSGSRNHRSKSMGLEIAILAAIS